MKLNILHLSDLHMSYRHKDTINTVVNALMRDIDIMKFEHGVDIHIVGFTGDLINKGEEHSTEINLACDALIFPLLNKLNVPADNFFIVPGNHEVDRSTTNKTIETGLWNSLSNLDSFDEFIKEMAPQLKDYIDGKLNGYNKFKETWHGQYLIETNYFYDVFKMPLPGNINLGILCLNSAWRSSDFGMPHAKGKDYGRLIIGASLFEKASERIEDCEIKIALMHHPFEMLTEWDRKSLQRAMAQNVDLMLLGHIHDSDFAYIQPILGNLYISTCASLYSGRIENGYSIISLDLFNKSLTVYLRKWYPERKEFDQETEKTKNGIVSFGNFMISNGEKKCLIELLRIRNHLQINNHQEVMLIPLETLSEVALDDVFVEPVISNKSNYDRSNEGKKTYHLNDLLESNDNLIFFGGKEHGKSFLLEYIRNEMLTNDIKFSNKIPVFTNFSKIPKNNFKAIINNIIIPALDGTCVKQDVEEFLDKGNIVLIIDDYDDTNDDFREKRKDVLKEFYQNYKSCRYIFSLNEKISQTFGEELLRLTELFQAKNYYIMPFNTAKVRELLKKWNSLGKGIDVDRMLKQIVYYFNHLQIPVTPMSVTLFIGVLFRDAANRNIRNEAYLIENYFESILEKLSAADSTSTFDFKDKESFLSHIAGRMAEKNKYEWDRIEFEQEKLDYFKKIGDDVPKDIIFDGFFEKGILQEYNHTIFFKFKFWFNFFLAKKMQKYNTFETTLIERHDYLKFSTAIAYKAGLDRNDGDLMTKIDSRTMEAFKDTRNRYLCQTFNPKDLENTLIVLNAEVEKDIREKNTDGAKDRIYDEKFLSYNQDSGKTVPDAGYDNILNLVTLSSDVMRNTTDIDADLKVHFLKNTIDHYICLMWVILESFQVFLENTSNDKIKELFFPVRDENAKKPDDDALIKRVKEFTSKLLPISIILYMSDHLANPKLKKTICTLLNDDNNIIHKMYYIFLLIKLDFKESINYVKELIEESKSIHIDTMIFLYLRIHCLENKLHDEDLDTAISLMKKILKRHSTKVPQLIQQKINFNKDTFESDFKQEIRLKGKK